MVSCGGKARWCGCGGDTQQAPRHHQHHHPITIESSGSGSLERTHLVGHHLVCDHHYGACAEQKQWLKVVHC